MSDVPRVVPADAAHWRCSSFCFFLKRRKGDLGSSRNWCRETKEGPPTCLSPPTSAQPGGRAGLLTFSPPPPRGIECNQGLKIGPWLASVAEAVGGGAMGPAAGSCDRRCGRAAGVPGACHSRSVAIMKIHQNGDHATRDASFLASARVASSPIGMEVICSSQM